MRIEVDMSELSALGRQLIEEAPRQARNAARKVTTAEGRQVKSRAQAAAPRDRGWLAQSGIRSKAWNNPGDVATSIFTVSDPEGRAVGFYQEYGTSRHPPQAFMEAGIGPAHGTYPPAVLAAIDPFAKPGPTGGGGDE